jgi:hypothetical protein
LRVERDEVQPVERVVWVVAGVDASYLRYAGAAAG